MSIQAIASLTLDSAGRLLVAPEATADRGYEHIYREATGIRWDNLLQAFYAYEPHRWEHEELLAHIASAVYSAYGEELRFTEATAWAGVTAEMKTRLQAVLA